MSNSIPDHDGKGGRATAIARGCVCLLVIVCGLSLRTYGFEFGLPAFAVKYGGSILWGAMLLLLLGIVAPSLRLNYLVLLAATVAVAVELFRLVHAPWLDGFRLTTVGALLLGRIFSAWNVVAYAAGITLAAMFEAVVVARLSKQNFPSQSAS